MRPALMAGGFFRNLNGGPGDRLARWGEPIALAIISQRVGSAGDEGEPVILTLATNDAVKFYQWRKNGIPLSNPSHISGIGTDTLIINPAMALETGSYDCVIGNECESLSSSTVLVDVSPVLDCRGDANSDGFIDFADITTVLGNWLEVCP